MSEVRAGALWVSCSSMSSLTAQGENLPKEPPVFLGGHLTLFGDGRLEFTKHDTSGTSDTASASSSASGASSVRPGSLPNAPGGERSSLVAGLPKVPPSHGRPGGGSRSSSLSRGGRGSGKLRSHGGAEQQTPNPQLQQLQPTAGADASSPRLMSRKRTYQKPPRSLGLLGPRGRIGSFGLTGGVQSKLDLDAQVQEPMLFTAATQVTHGRNFGHYGRGLGLSFMPPRQFYELASSLQDNSDISVAVTVDDVTVVQAAAAAAAAAGASTAEGDAAGGFRGSVEEKGGGVYQGLPFLPSRSDKELKLSLEGGSLGELVFDGDKWAMDIRYPQWDRVFTLASKEEHVLFKWHTDLQFVRWGVQQGDWNAHFRGQIVPSACPAAQKVTALPDRDWHSEWLDCNSSKADLRAKLSVQQQFNCFSAAVASCVGQRSLGRGWDSLALHPLVQISSQEGETLGLKLRDVCFVGGGAEALLSPCLTFRVGSVLFSMVPFGEGYKQCKQLGHELRASMYLSDHSLLDTYVAAGGSAGTGGAGDFSSSQQGGGRESWKSSSVSGKGAQQQAQQQQQQQQQQLVIQQQGRQRSGSGDSEQGVDGMGMGGGPTQGGLVRHFITPLMCVLNSFGYRVSACAMSGRTKEGPENGKEKDKGKASSAESVLEAQWELDAVREEHSPEGEELKERIVEQLSLSSQDGPRLVATDTSARGKKMLLYSDLCVPELPTDGANTFLALLVPSDPLLPVAEARTLTVQPVRPPPAPSSALAPGASAGPGGRGGGSAPLVDDLKAPCGLSAPARAAASQRELVRGAVAKLLGTSAALTSCICVPAYGVDLFFLSGGGGGGLNERASRLSMRSLHGDVVVTLSPGAGQGQADKPLSQVRDFSPHRFRPELLERQGKEGGGGGARRGGLHASQEGGKHKLDAEVRLTQRLKLQSLHLRESVVPHLSWRLRSCSVMADAFGKNEATQPPSPPETRAAEGEPRADGEGEGILPADTHITRVKEGDEVEVMLKTEEERVPPAPLPPVYVFHGQHLCHLMHEAGINLRYLPCLRESVKPHEQGLRQLIAAELLARTTKHVLRCRYRSASLLDQNRAYFVAKPVSGEGGGIVRQQLQQQAAQQATEQRLQLDKESSTGTDNTAPSVTTATGTGPGSSSSSGRLRPPPPSPGTSLGSNAAATPSSEGPLVAFESQGQSLMTASALVELNNKLVGKGRGGRGGKLKLGKGDFAKPRAEVKPKTTRATDSSEPSSSSAVDKDGDKAHGSQLVGVAVELINAVLWDNRRYSAPMDTEGSPMSALAEEESWEESVDVDAVISKEKSEEKTFKGLQKYWQEADQANQRRAMRDKELSQFKSAVTQSRSAFLHSSNLMSWGGAGKGKSSSGVQGLQAEGEGADRAMTSNKHHVESINNPLLMGMLEARRRTKSRRLEAEGGARTESDKPSLPEGEKARQEAGEEAKVVMKRKQEAAQQEQDEERQELERQEQMHKGKAGRRLSIEEGGLAQPVGTEEGFLTAAGNYMEKLMLGPAAEGGAGGHHHPQHQQPQPQPPPPPQPQPLAIQQQQQQQGKTEKTVEGDSATPTPILRMMLKGFEKAKTGLATQANYLAPAVGALRRKEVEPATLPREETDHSSLADASYSFWSMESRLWLLLGPFGSVGKLSMTSPEDIARMHICVGQMPLQLLSPLLRHTRINLHVKCLRRLQESGVVPRLRVEEDVDVNSAEAPCLRGAKFKGADEGLRKLRLQLRDKCRRRVARIPRAARGPILAARGYTALVNTVFRPFLGPCSDLLGWARVSVGTAHLGLAVAMAREGVLSEAAEEVEKGMKILLAKGGGAAPLNLCIAGDALRVVLRVESGVDKGATKEGPGGGGGGSSVKGGGGMSALSTESRDRLLWLWRLMQVLFPSSSDGQTISLWGSHPLVPVLAQVMHKPLDHAEGGGQGREGRGGGVDDGDLGARVRGQALGGGQGGGASGLPWLESLLKTTLFPEHQLALDYSHAGGADGYGGGVGKGGRASGGAEELSPFQLLLGMLSKHIVGVSEVVAGMQMLPFDSSAMTVPRDLFIKGPVAKRSRKATGGADGGAAEDTRSRVEIEAIECKGRIFTEGKVTGLSLEEEQAKMALTVPAVDEAHTLRPVPLAIPSEWTVRQVSCGDRHTALITTAGVMLTFGCGATGRLGHGDLKDQLFPKVVSTLVRAGVSVISAACGRVHTLAAAASGDVYSWGWGEGGRLGLGGEDGVVLKPERVPRIAQLDVRAMSVACGAEHSMIITDAGQLLVMGCGIDGRLGLGQGVDGVLVPTLVSEGGLIDEHVVMAAGGMMHSACVCESGTVYTWGYGAMAALGHGDTEDCLIPRRVQGLGEAVAEARGRGRAPGMTSSEGAAQGEREGEGEDDGEVALGACVGVACGAWHTLVLAAEGTVLSFGDGFTGQLGLPDRGGDEFRTCVPKAVPITAAASSSAQRRGDRVQIKTVACGSFTSAAISVTGELFYWGVAEAHQLGSEDPVANLPRRAEFSDLSLKPRFHFVAQGGYNTVAVTDNVSSEDQQEELRLSLASAADVLLLHQRTEAASRDAERGPAGEPADELMFESSSGSDSSSTNEGISE